MTTSSRWGRLLYLSPLVVAAQFDPASEAKAQSATNLPPVTIEGGVPRIVRSTTAPGQRASAPRTVAVRRAPVAQPPAAEVAPRESARGPVRGIVASRSATGTKTDASLLETPQSISVVTKDQIESQGARNVAEALRYEPGVVSESRVGDRFDNVFIRGFGGFGANANYLHFWDGLRLPRGISYAMPSIDPYTLERVEILRGPASVLYGQNNLGGMINLISKNPTSQARGEVFTRFGDHNRIEGGFDISGPLSKDGDLLYRLIGLGRKADTEVDYTTTERQLIAPTITWRPTEDTTLTVRASYSRDPSSYQPNWLPALGTLLPNPNGQIPKNFFSGHPNVNTYSREQTSVGYEFEHHFNEAWTIRQNFRYMEVSSEFKALSVTGFAAGSTCGAGTRTNLCLARSTTNYIEQLKAASIDTQVESRFNTGWLQHTVLAGIDYQTTSASARFGNGTSTNINYLNPNYGVLNAPAITTQTLQDREQLGIYVQDQIRLGKLAMVVGVRSDWAKASSDTSTISTGVFTSRIRPDDTAATWRAGATYQFDSGVAPYASYSTSFEPSTIGTDFAGNAFVPSKGEQYEVGVKYQPIGINGFFMFSYFDITQSNVLTTDAARPSAANPLCTASAGFCQIQQGEVRSKGIELSGKVTLQPGFDVIAAYSHTDIEIAKSSQTAALYGVTPATNVSVQGKTPVGAPSDTTSLWVDYTFQNGPLAGFGVGGGVRYIGPSFGDAVNSAALIVPAYTLGDLAVHYDLAGLSPQMSGWKLAVNMTNIADKTYVSACASSNQCFYGNGRTTLGTVRYQW